MVNECLIEKGVPNMYGHA